MKEIAAPEITDVIHSVDIIIQKNIQGTGGTVRSAGTPLKLRYTSFMGRTNLISKSWKTLPLTYLLNVRDAALLSLWDMIAIQRKEANIGAKNARRRKWRTPSLE
jgi:hypothetical protein